MQREGAQLMLFLLDLGAPQVKIHSYAQLQFSETVVRIIDTTAD